MAKIGVIIPCYNSSKFLNKCLDSIFKQTFKDIEVLVINDGSTDNSKQILTEYAKKHKNLKVINQENGGQAKARNKGIKLTNSDYLMFIDSDDFIEVDMLEKLYHKAIAENVDIVWCNMYSVIGQEKTVINNVVYSENEKKNYMINNAGPCAKLIRTDIIKNNDLYFLENHIYEDIAVVPSYALFSDRVVHINEPLYNYVIYQGSTMNQIKYNKKMESIFYALNNLKTIFSNNSDDKYNEELEYIFIENLLHAAFLRFNKFVEGKKSIQEINEIMHKDYPHWSKNKYFKQMGFKYKLVCHLIYNRHYQLLNFLIRK